MVTCSNCLEQIHLVPRFMRGNPLNQAIIIHEDGFNAFRQRSHGTSAIHFTSACVEKQKRKDSLQVYSFAPSSYIPEGITHKFDAFLEPLIEELKNLYVHGIEVVIGEDIDLGNYVVAAGTYTVRMILLLLKAIQEIVLYASGK